MRGLYISLIFVGGRSLHGEVNSFLGFDFEFMGTMRTARDGDECPTVLIFEVFERIGAECLIVVGFPENGSPQIH